MRTFRKFLEPSAVGYRYLQPRLRRCDRRDLSTAQPRSLTNSGRWTRGRWVCARAFFDSAWRGVGIDHLPRCAGVGSRTIACAYEAVDRAASAGANMGMDRVLVLGAKVLQNDLWRDIAPFSIYDSSPVSIGHEDCPRRPTIAVGVVRRLTIAARVACHGLVQVAVPVVVRVVAESEITWPVLRAR